MNGSRRQRNLYVLSLNGHISTRTMIFLPKRNLQCVNNTFTSKNSLIYSSSTTIFDDLPALRPITAAYRDELEKYLSTERELNAQDNLLWWHERKHIYPRLSWMAMDYLSIPGNVSLFIRLLITFFSNICPCRKNIQPGKALALPHT